MLDDFKQRCKSTGIEVDFTDKVINALAEIGTDSQYGARPLRRAITTHIEDTFAEKYLTGEIKQGMHLVCDWKNDEVELIINK
jgi:ATP-dependent Clp protease ATP-binding subunit ClpC